MGRANSIISNVPRVTQRALCVRRTICTATRLFGNCVHTRLLTYNYYLYYNLSVIWAVLSPSIDCSRLNKGLLNLASLIHSLNEVGSVQWKSICLFTNYLFTIWLRIYVAVRIVICNFEIYRNSSFQSRLSIHQRPETGRAIYKTSTIMLTLLYEQGVQQLMVQTLTVGIKYPKQRLFQD